MLLINMNLIELVFLATTPPPPPCLPACPPARGVFFLNRKQFIKVTKTNLIYLELEILNSE